LASSFEGEEAVVIHRSPPGRPFHFDW